MAVSKNKRKNDTKQKQKLRAQRMKQRVQSSKLNKKYKEAQQMAVIIKESLKDFNELKEVNDTLYSTLTNVVQKFKESEYDEGVDEETQKRLDGEITIIEGIIEEGKEVSKACEESFNQMVEQVSKEDFDPIDVNMNVISEFMSIKDHQEYLSSKADALREACAAKSKSIDINELNAILD
jgi:hypothetical protein